eukprot:12415155-Alexandrium_andersonii.AAC.1
MRSRQSRTRSSRPRRCSVSRSCARRPSSSPAGQGPTASSGKRAAWKSRRLASRALVVSEGRAAASARMRR